MRTADDAPAAQIDAAWQCVLADDDANIRAFAALAAEEPRLRALFPFISVNSLRFSTAVEYPFDFDLPYLQITPLGVIVACGGHRQVLYAGKLDEAVRRVAAAMPPMELAVVEQ